MCGEALWSGAAEGGSVERPYAGGGCRELYGSGPCGERISRCR